MPLVTINDLSVLSQSELQTYFGGAMDIRGLYEDFVENDDDGTSYIAGRHSSRGRAAGLHASEISNDCRRKAVYSLTGCERQDRTSVFWKKRFNVGHAFHALIQDDFHRMAQKSQGIITFESEVRLSPDLQGICKQWDIHSSADGILSFRDQPFGPVVLRVLLEIKTDSDKEFEKRNCPSEYHREQTHLYAKALNVPVIYYFYINKSNQNIAPSEPPYVEIFNFKIWERVLEKILASHEDVKRGITPDRVEGMACEFCPFSWTCDPEYLKRKEARRSFHTRISRALRTGIKAPKEALT